MSISCEAVTYQGIPINRTFSYIQKFAWSPDSEKIAVTDSKYIYIFNMKGEMLFQTVANREFGLVKWMDNDRMIFALEKEVGIYDLKKGTCDYYEMECWDFEFDPLNNRIFFIKYDEHFRMHTLDLETKKVKKMKGLVEEEIFDLFLNTKGDKLFYGIYSTAPDFDDWYVYDFTTSTNTHLSKHLFGFYYIDKENDVAYAEEIESIPYGDGGKRIVETDEDGNESVTILMGMLTRRDYVVDLNTLIKTEFNPTDYLFHLDGHKISLRSHREYCDSGEWFDFFRLSPDQKKAFLVVESQPMILLLSWEDFAQKQ